MHAANIMDSKRLQDCYAALRDGPKTTRQLINWTGSVAPHSDVAELRENQIDVSCSFAGMNNGRRVYVYQLGSA